MFEMFRPNYELHFGIRRAENAPPVSEKQLSSMNRATKFMLVFMCLANIFLYALLDKGPIQILPLLCCLVPLFVVLLCKNHMELALIPFALQAFFEVVEIIFNISSLFPLSLLGIIGLASLAIKIALLGLVFLSLYQPIPLNIKLAGSLLYVFAESTQYLLPMILHLFGEDFDFVNPTSAMYHAMYPMIIFFILTMCAAPHRRSRINPLPIIAVVLLCAVTVFGLSLITKNDDIFDIFDKDNKKDSNTSYYVTCAVCDGEGRVEDGYQKTCQDCNGIGTVRIDCTVCGGDGINYSGYACRECLGSGSLYYLCGGCGGDGDVRSRSECYACDGEGKIKKYD